MTINITGVGITEFGKLNCSLRELALSAAREALVDAGIAPRDIDQVFFANSLQGLLDGQEAIRGQVALQDLGLRVGTPVINVESACASSSFAVHLAGLAAASGECVLVVGAEKMHVGAPARTMSALATARDIVGVDPDESPTVFMDFYAEVARKRMSEFGLTAHQIASVAAKNSWHGSLNPLAQFRVARTIEEVLAAPMVVEPLTRFMCSPVSDGAAALVLKKGGAGPRVRASALTGPGYADDVAGIAAAGTRAYELAGIGPANLDVLEVHDASAIAEIVAYEALALCAVGDGGELAASGATTLKGSIPVNASGGLSARGHPVGATGAAQLVHLVRQLTGRAGAAQIDGARIALAENHGGALGPGPAAVCVTILSAD